MLFDNEYDFSSDKNETFLEIWHVEDNLYTANLQD